MGMLALKFACKRVMGSGDSHGSWLIAASNLAGSLLARVGLRDRCRCECRVLGGIPEAGIVDLLREQLARCDAPRGVAIEVVLGAAGAALVLGFCAGGALAVGLLRLGVPPPAVSPAAARPPRAPAGAPAESLASSSVPVLSAPAPALKDLPKGQAAATPSSLGRVRKRPGSDGR